MDINLTFIIQGLAFFAVAWLVMKFGWPHIMAAIEERQRKIAEGLAAADNAQKNLAQADAKVADELKAARAKYPPVEHPVVRVHPVTGKKVLYANSTFTSHIKGQSRVESDALLTQLFTLPQVPEFQARLRWAPGTLAVWDNRSTQHYAVGDFFPQHRKLHRITVTD